MSLPKIPCSFESFPAYLEKASSRKAVNEAVEPFKEYESKLRQIYAQEPKHKVVTQNHLVPVYEDGKSNLTIKARNLESESNDEQDHYLLPIPKNQRRQEGSAATTPTLSDFKKNFTLFCESSLADLNWDNVVVAGSSVATALLPVDAPHNESKRALRTYYHEQLAPASDVDLFLYDIDEEQAIEKIKQIETNVRDAILSETTVVRTKNAITIVSDYPTRHIQIVLRIYKSISEILTGFDVDCACVAFDGKQVWAAPRALAAFATQVNSVDLTRRSPSYENRLSKYSHRGFEVYWPHLDRSRVDPTIFERAFNRVHGLARLLVLEKLPHPQDRFEYLAKRREERGRPELSKYSQLQQQLPGNIKEMQPDDVAEWYDEDEVSNYHTLTIPYGPRYTPKKVERLLFSKDLLLNAEFNKPKDRETNLHRHPAFFGRVEDVIRDCCGYCPKPETDADLAAHEEESKTFINGDVSFLKDDPGRQAIGSFHPLTADDWTDMAYIGNTTRLSHAIVDQDLEAVKDWFGGENADVTRRDHTGRTPLHLAVICSTTEIVQYLIEHGARINARLYNGLTALHLASHRGNAAMVKLLLDRSNENRLEEDKKEDARKAARRAAAGSAESKNEDVDMDQSEDDQDIDKVDSDESMDEDTDTADATTEGSFVKVTKDFEDAMNMDNDKPDDPDVYDVDVVAWDSPVSALHLAIMAGHQDVIRLLIDEYGADVMLPIKGTTGYNNDEKWAILSLLLPLDLQTKKAKETTKTLLDSNASILQADLEGYTALHHIVYDKQKDILELLQEVKPEDCAKALKYILLHSASYSELYADTLLLTAIRSNLPKTVEKLLSLGADATIDYDEFVSKYKAKKGAYGFTSTEDKEIKKDYQNGVTQPIIQAALQEDMYEIIPQLIEKGADINSLTNTTWQKVNDASYSWQYEKLSVLDLVRRNRRKLEKFAQESDEVKKPKLKHPEPLKSDDHYLKGLTPGTYRHWSATKDLERAKFIQAERAKGYQHDFEKAKEEEESEKGLKEQKEAASEMAQNLKNLEDDLVKRGAKTFYELYPRFKKKDKEEEQPEEKAEGEEEEEDSTDYSFKPRFEFHGKDVTPSKTDRYIELFEAAYSGDIEKVKTLCIPQDAESKPLQISAWDNNVFTPFSIAILKGNYDLARVVLDVTAAQYDRSDQPKMRYSMPEEDSEAGESGDNDDGKPRFVKTLVSDKFTIDNVLAAQELKVNIPPTETLNDVSEICRFMDVDYEEALRLCRITGKFDNHPYIYSGDEKKPWSTFNAIWSNESHRVRVSLWTYAVVTNNKKLLKFLLDMEIKYTNKDPDELFHALGDRTEEMKLAMNLGHIEIVDMIIRHRGTFLPLQHLVKDSGIVIQETPKHYQGLSVYGKKRKDWAKQDEDANRTDNSEKASPLLVAILEGTMDVIDYFASDTPMRRYEEFTESFEQDPRIRALARAKGGIPASLKAWKNVRTNLILHMAVMSWPAGLNKRLKYLMDKVPGDYLEARSAEGETPLQLAIRIGNLPAVETLLAAGANQRTRDRKGRNLLHTIYQDAHYSEISLFKYKVSLLDKDVLNELIPQRCSGTEPGSLTPFALYLDGSSKEHDDIPLLDTMLDISGGKDLEIMDGAGDYPLHVLVRGSHTTFAKHLAKKRPDLVFWENATGMTPLEVAETHYFQKRINHVPQVRQDTKQWDIMDRPASWFAPAKEEEHNDKDETEEDDIPTTSVMYATLLRIARNHPQTRKLVSVLDANEVARRLAGKQHRKNAEVRQREARGLRARYDRYYSRNPEPSYASGEARDTGSKEDEVSKNVSTGQSRYTYVPWLNHGKDTPEEVEAGLEKFREFADGKVKVLRCCEYADNTNQFVRKDHSKMSDEIAWWGDV